MSRRARWYWFALQVAAVAAGIAAGTWVFDLLAG